MNAHQSSLQFQSLSHYTQNRALVNPNSFWLDILDKIQPLQSTSVMPFINTSEQSQHKHGLS